MSANINSGDPSIAVQNIAINLVNAYVLSDSLNYIEEAVELSSASSEETLSEALVLPDDLTQIFANGSTFVKDYSSN
jgi:hypothetical protein